MTQHTNRKRKGGERLAAPQRGGRWRRQASSRTVPRYDDADETQIWRPAREISSGEYSEPRQCGGTRQPPRRQAPKKKRSKGRLKLVLGIAAAVLLVLFVSYRLWAQAPSIPTGSSAADEGEAPGRPTGAKRKDGFYTFLIIGRDTGGGGNTDTLMLAAYDTKNQQAGLMSIPRDTMVDVSWDVKKINSVYNMYLGRGKEEAVEALADAVAGLVGFRPDYTVTVEWQAVGDIVNAIGGVYFEVPFYMSYVDPTQDLYIDQPEGYRLLTGEDAMQVVRWRKNNTGVPVPAGVDGSDVGRVKIQQAFMTAALKQCLKLGNITKIRELAQAFTDNVETELSVGNLVWFAEKAVLGGFSAEELHTCTMPYAGASVYSSSYNTYLSYVVPNASALLEEINGFFNPFEVEVTMDNLNIMCLNGNGGAYPSGGTPLG